MSNNRILKAGLIGGLITAICCFTPALVVLFGLLGLSALTGYLDLVLFPLLGLFILFIGFGLWKRKSP